MQASDLSRIRELENYASMQAARTRRQAICQELENWRISQVCGLRKQAGNDNR